MDNAAEDVAVAGGTIRRKGGKGEDFVADKDMAAAAHSAVACKGDDDRRAVRP